MPAPRRPRRPDRLTAPGAGDDALPPIRKSLGQHFLTDRGILSRIADALQATGTETIVEIGPGRGSLTEHLLPRAGKLVAVEYDRALAARLRDHYAAEPRVRVVEADVLDAPLADIAGTDDYLVVGNVPYYITTPILFHALRPPRPRRAVFLVQKEVADRLIAPPGTRSYGALSVNVQAIASVSRVFRVPAGAFHPPPRVESAVVRVEPRGDPAVTRDEEEQFRGFVQGAFGFRRKQMGRVLRSLCDVTPEAAVTLLHAAGIDPNARPETLAPADFAALMRATAVR
ncbi:MAG: 16S rRNA (adenine(1518)-N(6)/adenine(1519)-N(6))-dimethyltransferase RsmA [Gemmatimonadota bacterium]|nr:16S rRNA (adenine(1518)-N(6)/adenine(1519)-N(6))-dimethyltransferase RsmA [Gemmatimonadota bacterium]